MNERFLLGNHSGQKEVAHLSGADGKLLPTMESILVKLLFRNEREIMTFSYEGKQNLGLADLFLKNS